MKFNAIAVGAVLLATSGAAAAQSATDARCILLSNVFAQQVKDANAQKAAEASLYFYLGRISSAATAAQMKALFESQGKTITNANAGALMSDCAKAVQTKVDMLQSLAPPQPAAAKPAKPTPPQGR
jgi:hypothetical protein